MVPFTDALWARNTFLVRDDPKERLCKRLLYDPLDSRFIIVRRYLRNCQCAPKGAISLQNPFVLVTANRSGV